MKDNNSEISKLIYLFSKLPGLGQRSARRIVLHLLQDPEVRLKGLIALLQNTADKVVQCSVCLLYTSPSPRDH
jgi:recombination protein RecR